MLTVHPRAGGEHAMTSWVYTRNGGSSPRGRGTHSHTRNAKGDRRFIPARAGNTGAERAASRSSTVHPRAGGEHQKAILHAKLDDGSSPRGRGTRGRRRGRRRPRRFIPARAGNTRGAVEDGLGQPVHPRAGGEHAFSVSTAVSNAGSSPRGRGTQAHAIRALELQRFIPARAGNTAP